MDRSQLQLKAALFRSLHQVPGILILPNAWDVASARLFEELPGVRAIATSSAGVAAVLGYPDGQRISRDEMVDMVSRIARAVSVPVTADLEAGYGDDPEAVAETVRALIGAGGVGMNLEDGTGNPNQPLRDASLQVERIRAARRAAAAEGVEIVLNARVDVFLYGTGDPAERLTETIRRANLYREAGADSLFVIGAREAEVIGALAEGIGGPLNVLAGPGFPPIPELERLGVRRVSFGSGLARAALGRARKAVRELLEAGTYGALGEDAPTHQEINSLLAASLQ